MSVGSARARAHRIRLIQNNKEDPPYYDIAAHPQIFPLSLSLSLFVFDIRESAK
jgi:hypothetical protein